jgi:UDPglucose 6-dehydrogenase
MINKISFCGLSHLGLVYSAVYSKFAQQTVCYDQDVELIKNLNQKKIEIVEPRLKKKLFDFGDKIKFTNNIDDVVNSDLIFISLDVPTSKNGISNYSRINSLIQLIKNKLKKNSSLIILSQLFPGYCDKISTKKRFNLYYQVETLVFGQAIERALKPERIIVGSKIAKIHDKKYNFLLDKFNCPKLIVSYKTAEMTKISINIMLTSSAITANYLSLLSEKFKFDWRQVSESLRLDKRIGKYSYLNPSLGLSGGNLERDIYNLKKLSRTYNVDISIINSWNKISNLRKNWISNILIKLSKKYKLNKICLLGLSYKTQTNSIKNSNAIYTIKKMKNLHFISNDPVVKFNQISNIKNIEIKNIYQCIKSSKILIIATPWKQFLNYLKKNTNILKNKILIDPYNLVGSISNIKLRKRFVLGDKV